MAPEDGGLFVQGTSVQSDHLVNNLIPSFKGILSYDKRQKNFAIHWTDFQYGVCLHFPSLLQRGNPIPGIKYSVGNVTENYVEMESFTVWERQLSGFLDSGARYLIIERQPYMAPAMRSALPFTNYQNSQRQSTGLTEVKCQTCPCAKTSPH